MLRRRYPPLNMPEVRRHDDPDQIIGQRVFSRAFRDDRVSKRLGFARQDVS